MFKFLKPNTIKPPSFPHIAFNGIHNIRKTYACPIQIERELDDLSHLSYLHSIGGARSFFKDYWKEPQIYETSKLELDELDKMARAHTYYDGKNWKNF